MNQNLDPEFRITWLRKIKILQAKFGLSISPELIEHSLFEKSNNDAKTYINLIHNYFIGYKQRAAGLITSNLTPCVAGASSSNSDPLNALQNLTINAGQLGQIVSQQASTKMNNTIYNSHVRPKSSGATNQHRPIEKHSIMPQSTSQCLVSVQVAHGQQSLLSPSGPTSNVATTRLSNKNAIIKEDIDIPHDPVISSLDSCRTTIHGQHYFSQNMQRPILNKLYQNNRLPQPLQITSVLPNSVNHITDTSGAITSMSSVSRPSIFTTEEETKNVSEEIKKLNKRYLKFLKLIIENHKLFPEDQMKVFRVLKSILENPESITKPLSIKHVKKIEHHLIKAEHLWLNRETESGKCLTNSTFPLQMTNHTEASVLNKLPLVANNNESLQKSKSTAEENIRSGNVASLDLAFDEVCHQLMMTDRKVIQRVQKGLVKYVESKRHLHQYFLPKRLFAEEFENDDNNLESKRRKIDSNVDNDEFNYLDKIIEKINFISSEIPKDICHRQDMCEDMEDYNLEEEIRILKKDFEIKILDEEVLSIRWCTYDTEWESSSFYSISYNAQSLPSTVPSMKVRVPSDYQYAKYVDWNLNEELYTSDCNIFLVDIKKNLIDEFSKIRRFAQGSGVSLSFVSNVYKECILGAKSRFQNDVQYSTIRNTHSPDI